MHLDEIPFTQFRKGLRSIEARLNDEKRRKLKVGDKIKFINRANESEIFETEIIDLYHAKTFEELFSLFSSEEFGSSSKDQLLNNIYTYYSKEDEEKWGVVGIKVG